ncbi:MAG: hypothetical protein R3C11_29900, partial [Planctomycetaceae bacterium]
MFNSIKPLNPAGPSSLEENSVDHSNRKGATLVVVLALLGLMMVIGFFAYSLAGQQQANSEYFANTPRAKARNVADFDRDALMNWALEQIIKGAPAELSQSSLSGGRHALVPNMFGNDLIPYSGTGYNLMLSSNLPVLDYNYDGTSDGTAEPWMNASPAANGGSYPVFDTLFDYTPDAPYTAPDFNNTFLAYRGYALNANNEPVLVIKPSYHRPEMLRESSGHIRLVRDWMGTTGDETYSMRPSENHLANDGTGTFATERFVGKGETATGINNEFPFPDFTDYTETWSEGVWALDNYDGGETYNFGEWVYYPTTQTYFRALVDAPVTPPVDGSDWKEYTQPYYAYDVDADGDGTKEAIWMDLDFPIQETPDGGRFFVPMFGVTIYDAEGLINLNAAGNINGTFSLAGGSAFGNGSYISQSNLGVSPSEINPIWAFTAYDADCATTTDSDNAQAEHAEFFNRDPDTTADPQEIANMEWFWINAVKLTFNGGVVEDIILGRYGDDGIPD